MPNTLEHEQMRWNNMTLTQLETRLTRICDPIKFNNFLAVARMVNNAHLFTRCLMRMEEYHVAVQGTIDSHLDNRPSGAPIVSNGVQTGHEETLVYASSVTEREKELTVICNRFMALDLAANYTRQLVEECIDTFVKEGKDNAAIEASLVSLLFVENAEEFKNIKCFADIKKPEVIKPHRLIRIRGDKKVQKIVERKKNMQDLRNELNIDAPRAKGAYLEDAPGGIWTEHGWVLEDKEDAMRATMQIGADRSLLVGRNRKDFLKGVKKAGSFMSLDHKNPLLAFEVFSKEFEGTILDGELTETFKSATKKTIAAGKGIKTKLGLMEYDKYTTERLGIGDRLGYAIWDCLFYKGNDIRDRELWKRRKAAEHVIEKLNTSKLWLLEQFPATEKSIQSIFSRGKEGAIAKNIYHTIPKGQKTHPGYWKLKGDDKRTVDGFITGVQEALEGGSGVKGIKPKPSGRAASFTICMLDAKGKSMEVCKMKGNLTEDMIKYGCSEFHRFDSCVVEMKVSGWDGVRFRWPRYYRWREDKTWRDCIVSEQIGRIVTKAK